MTKSELKGIIKECLMESGIIEESTSVKIDRSNKSFISIITNKKLDGVNVEIKSYIHSDSEKLMMK